MSRRARRLQIKINPFGDVEVVLPQGMNDRHVPAFVIEHQDWIQKTQSRLLATQPAAESQSLPEKIALLAGNRCWDIEYTLTPCRRSSLSESPGLLTLQAANEQTARHSLQRWLNRKAKNYLLPCLQQLSDETGLLFQRLSIRAQKTRWGSCSASGTISLNRALMFLETKLIRYLLLHELCHTQQMNHSPRYWALVKSLEPAYQEYEKDLRAAAQQIPLWALTSKFNSAT